jgi:hypothetical protein
MLLLTAWAKAFSEDRVSEMTSMSLKLSARCKYAFMILYHILFLLTRGLRFAQPC